MLEHYIRPTYQKILVDPLAKFIFQKFSPNAATYVGIVTGVAVAPALIMGQNLIACALLLLSGFFDTLDGTLARLKNSATNAGSLLDIVGDRLVELAVVLGLFGVAPTQRGWLSLVMLGSILICVTTFLVVGIFTQNNSQKSFYYSPGLMERPEAFIFFLAMILFPQFFIFLAIIFSTLVFLTASWRIYEFNQHYYSANSDTLE